MKSTSLTLQILCNRGQVCHEIYAIKLEPGIYVITGVAIKLTRTMQEREHTLRELAKMEKVRSHLLTNNIVDKDSFDNYMNELI